MAYIDGFVLPVKTAKLKDYKKLATMAAKVWKEHGALEYYECQADDIDLKGVFPFSKTIKKKPEETVFFSWIMYKSKAHRNAVNKKVMKDERMQCMDPKNMPFDCKRMACGGFKVLVKG